MRSPFCVFVIVAALSLSGPAWAQDAEREARLALAERAVDAMQAEQMADQMTTLFQAVPRPSLDGLSGAERVAFDEVMAETMRTMTIRMLNGMVAVYAEIYTYEELEAMVAFYESPVGRSIIEKADLATPHIIALINEIMPDMFRQMANGLCDRLDCTQEERQELQREMLGSIGMTES
ncbi:MAG: DUF2059 domain-containing protein [Caulobacterales bacterium]|nr:DUF2059 domain-containing protein [Caulobacterales bacterium]